MYHQFNIHKFYVLPTEDIYVSLLTNVITNSDLSFLMPVRLSVSMVFQYVGKFEVKSAKNNGYATCRPMYIHL